MLTMIWYSFLTKIKNINLIFWPLVFPFVLTTAMYFSIGQIQEADFETVRAAVVSQAEKADETFLLFLDSMEQDSDLLEVEKMPEQDAVYALEKGEISGIFYAGEKPSLTVGGSGFPQTILQMVLESYIEGKETLEDVASYHPEGMDAALASMKSYGDTVEQISLGGRTTNSTAQFFYAMIGMACLYGCFIGYGSVMELQANLTPLAARRCAGPANRMKMILTELLVSFTLHFVNMMILLAYMKYILRLEFSGSFAEMLPVLFLGSMIGVTMGMFITSMGRMGEGMKIGIMVGVSMIMSFMAGLMNGNMKNVIDRSFPVLNRINPAALISDAMYCINVYDSPERYFRDMMLLGGLCVLMAAGTFMIIRRKRYDSI